MFDTYVSLGDSMSIDDYPFRAAEKSKIKSPKEIGPASLFFKNESVLFPEFNGKDLITKFQKIKHKKLAFDGATSENLLSEEHLHELVKDIEGKVLVTLTLGGMDILTAIERSANQSSSVLLERYAEIKVRYQLIVTTIKEKLKDCTLILTTLYDPTGVMPEREGAEEEDISDSENLDAVSVEYLNDFNAYIKEIASKESTLLADVHSHFKGHGVSCGSKDQFWYWLPSPIEPNHIGASEIRRVWLSTLQDQLRSSEKKSIAIKSAN